MRAADGAANKAGNIVGKRAQIETFFICLQVLAVNQNGDRQIAVVMVFFVEKFYFAKIPLPQIAVTDPCRHRVVIGIRILLFVFTENAGAVHI